MYVCVCSTLCSSCSEFCAMDYGTRYFSHQSVGTGFFPQLSWWLSKYCYVLEIQLQKISIPFCLYLYMYNMYIYIYMYISLAIPFQYQPLQYKITEIKRKARVWGLDWTLILVKSSSCPWSAWVEHPHKSQNVSAFAMDRYGLNSFDFAARCCTLSPSRGWARSNDPALLHWQPHAITKLSPCWSKMAPNKSLIPRDESLQVLPLQCGKSQPATRSAQSLKPNDILLYC